MWGTSFAGFSRKAEFSMEGIVIASARLSVAIPSRFGQQSSMESWMFFSVTSQSVESTYAKSNEPREKACGNCRCCANPKEPSDFHSSLENPSPTTRRVSHSFHRLDYNNFNTCYLCLGTPVTHVSSPYTTRGQPRLTQAGNGLGYMSGSLFEEDRPIQPEADTPLADRMRPRTLDDVVGQGHLLDPGKP